LTSRDLEKYTTKAFLLPNKYFYIPKTQPICRLGNWTGRLACPRSVFFTGVDCPLDGGS
jgi:hypothetical protein